MSTTIEMAGDILPELGRESADAETAGDALAFAFPKSPDQPGRFEKLERFGPSVITMIRMDHSHVMLAAHRFDVSAEPSKRRAVADLVCAAVEIHAQLEEEIFYPALRSASGPNDVLAKSEPEHDQMREAIAKVRAMDAQDDRFNDLFMELVRDVLHHVADEETILLPMAERLIPDRLGELGLRMTKRRAQLVVPRVGEIAISTARTMPVISTVAAAGVVGLGFLVARFVSARKS